MQSSESSFKNSLTGAGNIRQCIFIIAAGRFFDISNNMWVGKSISSVKMRGDLVNSIKRLQSRRYGMWIQNVSISNTEITVDCKGFLCYQKKQPLYRKKKSIFILDIWVKWSTWALNDNLLSSKVFVWWYKSAIWVTMWTSYSWVKTFQEQMHQQEKQA